MQSKLHSWLETICNTLSGLVISFMYQHYVANPQLGVSDTALSLTFFVVIQFTVISIVRGYFWRRLWNKIMVWEKSKHKVCFNCEGTRLFFNDTYCKQCVNSYGAWPECKFCDKPLSKCKCKVGGGK